MSGCDDDAGEALLAGLFDLSLWAQRTGHGLCRREILDGVLFWSAMTRGRLLLLM